MLISSVVSNKINWNWKEWILQETVHSCCKQSNCDFLSLTEEIKRSIEQASRLYFYEKENTICNVLITMTTTWTFTFVFIVNGFVLFCTFKHVIDYKNWLYSELCSNLVSVIVNMIPLYCLWSYRFPLKRFCDRFYT